MQFVCHLPEALTIVALGSSFSSGPGLVPLVDSAAQRSAVNFAHLFSDKLPGSKLVDLSVGGATLLNLLDTPQTRDNVTFAPQTQGVPADADVVTLLGGGNDLGLIGGLLAEAAPAWYRDMLAEQGMQIPPYVQPNTTAQEVEDRFLSVIDDIHRRAPKAKIFLVEYLQVVGPDTVAGRDIQLDASRVEFYRERQKLLHRVNGKVVKQREFVKLLPAYKWSRHHTIGSEDPWVIGYDEELVRAGRAAMHPNYRGMGIIADNLYGAYVEGECTRQKKQRGGSRWF